MIYVLSALAGFAYGCLFCYGNHKILMNAVDSVDPVKEPRKAATKVMRAYIFRWLVSLVSLVLVIFICKLLPLHFLSTIIAAAVGLTVPSQIWHIRHDKVSNQPLATVKKEVVVDDGTSAASAPSEKPTKEATAPEQKDGDWQVWEDWNDWDTWEDDDRNSSQTQPSQKEETTPKQS